MLSSFKGVAPGTPNLTVVTLTYNEDANLPACLASVKDLAHQIFIVDSGSTDRTREVASTFGAVIVEHPFETHARQWKWALDNLPILTEWVLALDADQRLTPELGREIRDTLSNVTRRATMHGYYVRRRQVFRGKWIKYGGYYPKYLLKLFRRESVSVDEGDLLDHHFIVKGPVGKLRHDLVEENRKEESISFWIEKHNRYSTLVAMEEHRLEGRIPGANWAWTLGNPDERVRWSKHVWRRLPRFVRPILYFIYRYFVRLGFLDGKQGFIFHSLHAFWFRMLVDIKLDEMRTQEVDSRGTPPKS